jgi:hypothetical protein
MLPSEEIDSTPLPRWAEARKINIVHIWWDYTNNNKHCRRNISSELQKTNAKTLHIHSHMTDPDYVALNMKSTVWQTTVVTRIKQQ